MNFTDYFVKGLRHTLKLKNDRHWSWKGTEISVPAATVIDEWYVGEFSTATYDVAVEYGVNDIEHITVVVNARVGHASITAHGRSNFGRDLVSFDAIVNNSKVKVIASPLYQADKVTPLVGIKLSFKATYIEKLIPSAIPTQDGPSPSEGGQAGVGRNWTTTDFPSGFLNFNERGSITVSGIHKVSIPGQSDLIADFILTKLNIEADNSIAVSLDASTSTVTMGLDHLSNLTITGSFNLNPTVTSSINNTSVGQAVPLAGTFTTLTTTSLTTFDNINQAVSFQPTGTGTVTVNPEATGSIDRVSIGNVTPKPGIFTDLASNSTVTFNSSQNVSLTPSGTVAFAPTQIGSIDNMVIGASVPASGRFTTVTILNPSMTGDQLITLSQLQALLLGAGR